MLKSSDDLREHLEQKLGSAGLPLEGGLELTTRCNLKCVHCYIPGMERESREPEMPLQMVKRTIDDLVAAGCIWLQFTGGEPLLRKDFPEIYHHAWKKGLLLMVYSNGTRISDEVISLFRQCRPLELVISFYGNSRRIFESITQVKGSHRDNQKGIFRLKEAGISVTLNVPVLAMNTLELPSIVHFARRHSLKARYSDIIYPRIDGDRRPLTFAARIPRREELGSRCMTGITSFFVDARGRLCKCPMVRKPALDFEGKNFGRKFRSLKDSPCPYKEDGLHERR
jgi:sulfatase maturation enzyme AslB (radical SAM superfamily)